MLAIVKQFAAKYVKLPRSIGYFQRRMIQNMYVRERAKTTKERSVPRTFFSSHCREHTI